MERHPNADLLHAIADGKTIQRYVHDTNEWIEVSNPLEALIEGLMLRVGETYMNINGFKVPSPIEAPPK
jgi:hypothetical protein